MRISDQVGTISARLPHELNVWSAACGLCMALSHSPIFGGARGFYDYSMNALPDVNGSRWSNMCALIAAHGLSLMTIVRAPNAQ
jgi:hypothetical protein